MGGGVFILIPVTGKEQESELPKNARVFQILSAGIVPVRNFCNIDKLLTTFGDKRTMEDSIFMISSLKWLDVSVLDVVEKRLREALKEIHFVPQFWLFYHVK